MRVHLGCRGILQLLPRLLRSRLNRLCQKNCCRCRKTCQLHYGRTLSRVGLGLPVPTCLIIVQHAPGPVFRLFFGLGDLRQAAAKLKALNIPVEKSKSMLSIHDPDGNQLIFVKVKPA
jgi:hypothetical protein